MENKMKKVVEELKETGPPSAYELGIHWKIYSLVCVIIGFIGAILGIFVKESGIVPLHYANYLILGTMILILLKNKKDLAKLNLAHQEKAIEAVENLYKHIEELEEQLERVKGT